MRLPTASLLCLLAVLLSCSSGGSRSRALDLLPALISAVFLGSGPSPVAGDKLQLMFSEDVKLVASAALDDADVDLSGSLGAVSALKVVSPRVIEVTLGAGVSFTVGTATIDMSGGNDVVQDLAGTFVPPSSAVAISGGDNDDPVIGSVTFNQIDLLTNGTGPAGGTLQVPPNGFTIDVSYSDSGFIDTTRTIIVANVEVTASAGRRAIGENLAPDLTVGTTLPGSASYLVPVSVVFPLQIIQITVYVVDGSGRISAPRVFEFRVTGLFNALRPLETVVNAEQVWYLDLTRDVESYSVNLSNSTTPVVVSAGPSGKSDLEELFAVIGLQNPSSPIPNVIGSKNSDQVVMDMFRAELARQLEVFYMGVNVRFTFDSPGPFPSTSGTIAYSSGGFSQICIAGSQDTGGATGVLGLAMFDGNNREQNNDCLTSFGAMGDRLGVFLHTIINSGFKESALSFFRGTYDGFTPVRGGTPIGGGTQAQRALDKERLAGTRNDARNTDIQNAINRMARFCAVVTAHECGHSMGLVPDGAMPGGLYGGDSANFPGSNRGHIVMPASIFPLGATNIMSPSLGFGSTQNPATGFNQINKAYLREQVLYDFK